MNYYDENSTDDDSILSLQQQTFLIQYNNQLNSIPIFRSTTSTMERPSKDYIKLFRTYLQVFQDLYSSENTQTIITNIKSHLGSLPYTSSQKLRQVLPYFTEQIQINYKNLLFPQIQNHLQNIESAKSQIKFQVQYLFSQFKKQVIQQDKLESQIDKAIQLLVALKKLQLIKQFKFEKKGEIQIKNDKEQGLENLSSISGYDSFSELNNCQEIMNDLSLQSGQNRNQIFDLSQTMCSTQVLNISNPNDIVQRQFSHEDPNRLNNHDPIIEQNSEQKSSETDKAEDIQQKYQLKEQGQKNFKCGVDEYKNHQSSPREKQQTSSEKEGKYWSKEMIKKKEE